MNMKSPAKNQSCLPSMMRWLVLSLFAAGFFADAQSTNDSSATTDYSSFQVIVQRNIFDPNRYPRQGRQTRRRDRGAPTFSLAGTMSYRKGMFAFFSGTSSEYQKAIQQGGAIAGYTVTNITFDGAQLLSAGKKIDMKVGSAMRQESGEWVLSQPGEWSPVSATDTDSETQSTNGTPAVSQPSGGGPASDVLKRLMERRQQEIK
jgi:hypothetical protein